MQPDGTRHQGSTKPCLSSLISSWSWPSRTYLVSKISGDGWSCLIAKQVIEQCEMQMWNMAEVTKFRQAVVQTIVVFPRVFVSYCILSASVCPQSWVCRRKCWERRLQVAQRTQPPPALHLVPCAKGHYFVLPGVMVLDLSGYLMIFDDIWLIKSQQLGQLKCGICD